MAIIWFHLTTSLDGNRARPGEPAAGEGHTVAPVDGSGMDGADAVCHPVFLPDSPRSPPGGWSWLHGLALWTLISMGWGIVDIRKGNIRGHANSMKGVMVGAIAAGTAALAPARFLAGSWGTDVGADQNSRAGNGCGARGSAQGWPGWGSSK